MSEFYDAQRRGFLRAEADYFNPPETADLAVVAHCLDCGADILEFDTCFRVTAGYYCENCCSMVEAPEITKDLLEGGDDCG